MHKIEAERDEILGRAVERSIEHAVFGGELGRRAFITRVGASTAAAALASVFPLGAAKALAQDKAGPPEKKDLKVGFIPITCATPIIMAEPMGFYKKHGLNVQVTKASSWAMIRDLSINGETDATHMLSPMPLAISLGVGSQSVPYVMPAVENINGQAITLATKHKAVKSPAEMKGFKFGVPFDYSMHNFLLRYYLAEGDEPFAQIDALTRGVIQDELVRMWSASRNTVFMVTHDVDEAILLSDRIALMTRGPRATLAAHVEVKLARPAATRRPDRR